MCGFVDGWRCRDKHRAPHQHFKFIKAQWPIVERRRQPKAVVHQIFLARTITLVHAADLRNCNVTFIDEHQRIRRQVVDQCRRRIARFTPGQMARIVFDAFAKAHFIEHFQIKARALFNALAFNQLVRFLVNLDAVAQFILDRLDGAQGRRPRRNVMARRVYGEAPHPLQNMPGQGIEHLYAFHLVIE